MNGRPYSQAVDGYVVWMHRDGRVTAVLAMNDREACERYAAYKNARQYVAWFEVRRA